jgi:hypothetical protein
MDPNEAFADLINALTDEDYETAWEAAGNLQEWLDGGGFPPDITPLGWRHLMDGIRATLGDIDF